MRPPSLPPDGQAFPGRERDGLPPRSRTGWKRVLPATAASLFLSAVMFSPRLWLMRHYMPGTFQWDRAHTFLLQCADPFRHDIEPAMLWRLLPPIVCHSLGLQGYVPLALPWLGVIALTAYVASLFDRRHADWRFVFGGTLTFATTSAVLVAIGWFGINDAWAWLGLLVVAFSDSPWARAAACFLSPWVDERFLIGLPLAFVTRWVDRGEKFSWRICRPALFLVPYVALRVALSFESSAMQPTRAFLTGQLHEVAQLLPWAPLAWWMGLRAAWVPAAFAITRRPFILGTGAILTLLVCLCLAADMSRSAAALVPLVLLGAFRFASEHPRQASRAALMVGIANLLIPAAHVSYTKLDPINNLLIELFRLFHM